MELSSILSAEAIRSISAVSSKKRLLQEVGELTAATYNLEADIAVEALLEREALGPTGVGKGIALPHARLQGLESVIGVFLRLEKPIDFDSVDRQPVDLVFALFAPPDTGVEHLKALALVSRTLRDANVCAKLRSSADAATLHAVLTEATTSEAA
ncbi:PTS system nitrogen-specific IIA component, PtsN [Candidatus Rhodobacter oscarellae]|uniref:PTS system nitrogen-specific IIA component, PtsN n=1 Tax=Candidatus Rhodobacter oscarellae TaxID=1675527 RepID=A0A0J9E7R3_9RHOB|nr:PTS sugar transporter subunit IIA [Candidatus Rhodobacter lobularis]KMW58785.1 PTS system nitrogen-specific IIA component, PtsN [Candidatus Rhodobacter lobularis]